MVVEPAQLPARTMIVLTTIPPSPRRGLGPPIRSREVLRTRAAAFVYGASLLPGGSPAEDPAHRTRSHGHGDSANDLRPLHAVSGPARDFRGGGVVPEKAHGPYSQR